MLIVVTIGGLLRGGGVRRKWTVRDGYLSYVTGVSENKLERSRIRSVIVAQIRRIRTCLIYKPERAQANVDSK